MQDQKGIDVKSFTKGAAAIAATAVVLAGCSSPTPSSKAGQADSNISYAFWGNNSEAATLKAIVAKFTSLNPEIHVTTNWIQADYEQKLQTSIAAGTQSTVMQISNTSLAGFAPSFQEQQVNPALFVQSNISSSMQVSGKYYATPFVAKPKVMAINVDMFKKAGIPIPDKSVPMTREQYSAIATKLSSGNGQSRVFGSANLWFEGWLTASGGSFYSADGSACTAGDATGVGTAQWIIDAERKAHFAPTPTEVQGQDQAHWFAAGRLGTLSDFGPWNIADYAALKTPNWTLVPVPGKGFPMEVDGLAISKKATGTELANAKKFVQFVSSQTQAQDLLVNGKSAMGVPVIKGSSETFESVLPASFGLAAFTAAVKTGMVGISVAKATQTSGDFDKGLTSDTALGSGKGDPATVLPKLNDACTKTLAN
jgi:multiple sugar transport system substrate-binding protein